MARSITTLEYPRVENFNGTSERSPWEVRFRESNEIFDQNWYSVSDFYSLKVTGNGENDSGNIVFFQKLGMILIILRASICFSQNFGIKQLGMLLRRDNI